MKILSFTPHQVVPTLYEFISSAEDKERYYEERFKPNSWWTPLIKKIKKQYASQCGPSTVW